MSSVVVVEAVDERFGLGRRVEQLADSPEHGEDARQVGRVDALDRRLARQARRGPADGRLVHRADVALFLRQDQVGPELGQGSASSS